MQLIDPNHPFYRPLWARLLIVGICFAWAIGEALGGAPMWAMIAGALGVYAGYVLLLTFRPQPPESKAETAAGNDEAAEDPVKPPQDGEAK